MMYYNKMMLAYIASDVTKVGLSTKEKAKKTVYEIEAHLNIRSYSLCAASGFSMNKLRKGRIAACLASIFPGLLGLFQLALSRRRVVIIPE